MSFTAYSSKPVTIDAAQWDGTAEGATPIIDYVLANGGTASYMSPDEVNGGPGAIFVDTLEGRMRLSATDWMIEGTEGEFYPCKDSVFQRKYEAAR